MKTYHYETASALQAAMNRRAARAHAPRIPAGAAGSIGVNDMWVLILTRGASRLIRITADCIPDNDMRYMLPVVLKPDAVCYIIDRGPRAYCLDAVSVNYIRRYVRPV